MTDVARETLSGKTCTRCGETKSLEAFARNGKGRAGKCKGCQKAYNREQHVANREKNKERRRARNAANPEHARAQYAANRETQKERRRARYAANREEGKERSRAWKAANPEKAKEYQQIARGNSDKVRSQRVDQLDKLSKKQRSGGIRLLRALIKSLT